MGGEESVRVQLIYAREARCGWCAVPPPSCAKKKRKASRDEHARTHLLDHEVAVSRASCLRGVSLCLLQCCGGETHRLWGHHLPRSCRQRDQDALRGEFQLPPVDKHIECRRVGQQRLSSTSTRANAAVMRVHVGRTGQTNLGQGLRFVQKPSRRQRRRA